MFHIKDKEYFLNLWTLGLIGNRLRAWSNVTELLNDPNPPALVNMRSHDPKDPRERSSKTVYGIRFQDVCKEVYAKHCDGVDIARLYFNEPAPDEVLKIQGYLARGAGEYILDYSTAVNVKMQQAMQHPKKLSGLSSVTALLRKYMDPTSFVEVFELLDEYPDCVVEFSTYGQDCGILPGRNTLIWEVRASE